VLGTWQWQRTVYSNDTLVEPADSSEFVASFAADGTFSSGTDCNAVFGSYGSNATSVSFGPLAATKMFCGEDTVEAEYTSMLAEVESYMVNDEGNLVLMLKFDSGSMIFTPSDAAGTE